MCIRDSFRIDYVVCVESFENRNDDQLISYGENRQQINIHPSGFDLEAQQSGKYGAFKGFAIPGCDAPIDLRLFELFKRMDFWESLANLCQSYNVCLLYTSDAADDLLCVAFGGRSAN